MNCINHPDTPAVAYCRTCGRALCQQCERTFEGTVYCEEHTPALAAGTPASAATPPPLSEHYAGGSPYEAGAPASGSGYAAGPAYAGGSPYAGASAPYDAASSPYTTPPVAAQPGAWDPGVSPGLAFVLGLIPGVGAIYNGQYVKGLVHVIILGVLISVVSSDSGEGLRPLFGMLISVWWFYMAFEAYHTARKRQIGQPVDEFSSIMPLRTGHRGFPVAPVLLIAIGILFLLNTMEILRFGQLIRYWPVALIVLGAYMLYERVAGVSAAESAQREISHEQR
jgi:hypothetical protein